MTWISAHELGSQSICKKSHRFGQRVRAIGVAALADLIVVSRDTSEFVAAGVPAFDPWDWNLHTRNRVLRVAD
jgi:hypothetical protein